MRSMRDMMPALIFEVVRGSVAAEVLGQVLRRGNEPAAGVDGDGGPADARVLLALAPRPLTHLLRRAVVHALWRVRDQAGRHRPAVHLAAVAEGDLVVVDVAVVPRDGLGARRRLGELGQDRKST